MTPMIPLRQRMTQDMQIRNLSPRTIECYTYHVGCFAKHFGRSPQLLGMEEVRAYQCTWCNRRRRRGRASTKRFVPYGFCTA